MAFLSRVNRSIELLLYQDWCRNNFISASTLDFMASNVRTISPLDHITFRLYPHLMTTNPLPFYSSMKRTFPSPIPLQLQQSLIQLLPPLPLEILRSNIRNIISSRIILISLITRHRPPQSPSQPCHGAPAVPKRGLDIVRRGLPLLEEEAAVLIRFLADRGGDQEVRSWQR